ncbi:hypothetical protein LPJ72_000640 [Coemansia sp. Benny D160-2]|nr:hypothetical protein LPJ72_000640 [Coemansia sp. Benny D160-2]
MDSFLSTVSSQTIRLDGYDTMGSPISIPLCYWYENGSNVARDEFMPAKALENAFYKTLEEFPILAGYVKIDTDRKLFVEVNKDDLNMPVYTDTVCDLDYSDMHKFGFNIDRLPISSSSKCGVPVSPGLFGKKIKTAYVHVVRFKDNGGVLVYASIMHCLFDGYGFTRLVNRWAEIARWMVQPQDAANKAPFPACEYIYDRAVPTSIRSSETTSLDSSMVKTLQSSNIISKCVTWLSPELRGQLLKRVIDATSYTCSFFHIPSKTMESIRDSVQRHAPPGIRYSINDVIIAYLTIVVAQAKKQANSDRISRRLASSFRTAFGQGKKSKPTGEFKANLSVSMHTRLSHPDAPKYLGNMSMGRDAMFPETLVYVEPTDEALSALALIIHEVVASSDEKVYSQLGYLAESKADNYLRMGFGTWTCKKKLLTSNHSRLGHYEVDFGAGIPSLVRHGPQVSTDVAYVMATNPKVGGYEIELKLAPEVAAKVVQNASWMKLVDKFEYYK